MNGTHPIGNEAVCFEWRAVDTYLGAGWLVLGVLHGVAAVILILRGHGSREAAGHFLRLRKEDGKKLKIKSETTLVVRSVCR